MGEWISVKDKLPEKQGRCLTHSIIAGQSLVAILWYDKYGYGFDKEVTHWQPLPEPPKESDGDTENELTDSDIKKALECCYARTLYNYTCGDCPLENKVCMNGNVLKKHALDLINRQKAEIIAKTEEYNDMLEQRNKCEAEIERLKKEKDVLKTNNHSMCISMSNMAKAERVEAIKEFARELKCGVPQKTGVIRCKDIDNLVKEMAGE